MSKIPLNRNESSVVYNATSSIILSEFENRAIAMEHIESKILHNDSKGTLVYDGPTLTYTGSNNETKKNQSNRKKTKSKRQRSSL